MDQLGPNEKPLGSLAVEGCDQRVPAATRPERPAAYRTLTGARVADPGGIGTRGAYCRTLHLLGADAGAAGERSHAVAGNPSRGLEKTRGWRPAQGRSPATGRAPSGGLCAGSAD